MNRKYSTMKYKKTAIQPAKEYTYVDHVVCDLCKGVIEKEGYGECDRVNICHREGSEWPEDGYGTETTLDVCSKCFKDKVLVWFKNQGAVPQVEEWDY